MKLKNVYLKLVHWYQIHVYHTNILLTGWNLTRFELNVWPIRRKNTDKYAVTWSKAVIEIEDICVWVYLGVITHVDIAKDDIFRTSSHLTLQLNHCFSGELYFGKCSTLFTKHGTGHFKLFRDLWISGGSQLRINLF